MRHPRFPGSSRTGHLIVAGALALLGVAAVPAMGTTGPAAELANDNLFMGTTKVEAGARANGSFGSTAGAPAGYHPRSEYGPILGFRVNATECNWDDAGCVTLGDFFTPGSPYESWGIQIGEGAPGFNSIYPTGIPGAFTSAGAAGQGGVTGVWRSAGDFDGIAVKQTYSIPPYAWMIDTRVDLTNTSGAPVDDVYVMRGVDPDNCRMETLPVCDSDGDGVADSPGSYGTLNTVETAQGSSSAGALVTATQTDDSYLGLRAVGPEARAFVQNGGFSDPQSLSALWSGADPNYHSTPASTFDDAGIYTVVRVPTIAPGATATVHIQYVVREIPAAVDVTQPVAFDGELIDVAALNGPGAVLQGICTDPSHGTATPEDGKVRYTPVPGFTGSDSFTYSTGGPCGTFTLSVPPGVAAPAPPSRSGPEVVLLGTAKRTTLASGKLRMSQRVRFNRTGRYTFIFNDPATTKRVLQYRGSRVGARLLSKTFSAPVVVTSREGKTLTLVSIFNKLLPAKVKKDMTLRIVLKSPDGTLSDATR